MNTDHLSLQLVRVDVIRNNVLTTNGEWSKWFISQKDTSSEYTFIPHFRPRIVQPHLQVGRKNKLNNNTYFPLLFRAYQFQLFNKLPHPCMVLLFCFIIILHLPVMAKMRQKNKIYDTISRHSTSTAVEKKTNHDNIKNIKSSDWRHDKRVDVRRKFPTEWITKNKRGSTDRGNHWKHSPFCRSLWGRASREAERLVV